jgi:hypothetical protein
VPDATDLDVSEEAFPDEDDLHKHLVLSSENDMRNRHLKFQSKLLFGNVRGNVIVKCDIRVTSGFQVWHVLSLGLCCGHCGHAGMTSKCDTATFQSHSYTLDKDCIKKEKKQQTNKRQNAMIVTLKHAVAKSTQY